jgi:stigma-specific protein Stig1
MDRIRFDGLSRTLARCDSRRGALRFAAAAILGLGAETARAAQARRKHQRCKAPAHAHCNGGHCVNLLTDPTNCGLCGNVCDAGIPQCVDGMCCGGGECLCAAAGAACTASTCCSGHGLGGCVQGQCSF